jgi:hypothetical protein
LWQKEITPLDTGAHREKSDVRAKAGMTRLRRESLPARLPLGKDILTLTRVTEHVTQTVKALTTERQKRQRQSDVGNSLIRLPRNALQAERGNREVALYTSNLPAPRQDLPDRQAGLSIDTQDSRSGMLSTEVLRPRRVLPPESLSRKVETQLETNREGQSRIQTNKSRDKLSRAEEIVLSAIRSRADIDGKNAKVAYESLAAMIGFSKRHVIRTVKSHIPHPFGTS